MDWNPDYPNLGTKVARLRRGSDHKAHGAAVLEAIRRLQRSDLNRETPSHNVHCASGTNLTTGKAILKAVAQQHRGYHNPDAIRKARSLADLEERYAEAMKEKKERSAEIIAFKSNERRPSHAYTSLPRPLRRNRTQDLDQNIPAELP